MPSDATKPRKTNWWLCSFGLLATAVLVWLSDHRDLDSIDLPRPAMRSDNWIAHYWLTNEQLLVVVAESAGAHGQKMQAELIDLPSCRKTRLDVFTASLQSPGLLRYGVPNDGIVSPDGTWLYINQGYDRQLLQDRAGAINIRTGQQREWFEKTGLPAFWSDDHTVAYLTETPVEIGGNHAARFLPTIRLHDARTASGDRSVTREQPGFTAALRQFDIGNPFAAELRQINYGNPNSIANANKNSWPSEIISQYFDERKNALMSDREPIALPPDVTSVSGTLHRRTIAVCLSQEYIHPFSDWLSERLPALAPEPTRTQSVWTTSVDGSGLVQIACVPDDAAARIRDLKWLPGGNQVSFVYKSNLYILPVNR